MDELGNPNQQNSINNPGQPGQNLEPENTQDMKTPKKKSNIGSVIIVIILVLVIAGAAILKFYPDLIDFRPKPDDDFVTEKIRGGEVDFNSGDYQATIQKADELLATNLSDEDERAAMLAKATAYLQKGTIDFDEENQAREALFLLVDLLNKNSEDPEAWRLYAYAHEILGDFDIALDSYEKSILLYGDTKEGAFSYSGRGHVYDLMGEKDKALSDYNKALELDSGLDIALLGRARVYAFQEDFESAISDIEKLFTSTVDSRTFAEALQVYGSINLVQGDYALAKSHFEKSIEYDNKFTQSLVGLAKASLHQILFEEIKFDDKDSADAFAVEIMSYAERALEIHPYQTSAHVVIAEIYTYYYGDYDEARKIYDNVMMNIVGNDITLGALEKDIMRSVIKKELERINTLEQNGF